MALDERTRAVKVLLAIGTKKLRRVAMVRAKKWAKASAEAEGDRHYADIARMRAAEWWRIGSALTETS